MPSKRRHSHRKKLSRSKKEKSTSLTSTVDTQQEAVVQPARTIVQPKIPAPSADALALTSARYPFIATELKRIGILFGIILVILVVLSLVLS